MKVGCDIVEVKRFIDIDQRFLDKYFTKGEVEYINSKSNKAQTTAGIFALKESVLKALQIGMGNGLALKQIEVSHSQNGAPNAKINVAEYANISLNVSISHTDDDAMAVCIIESK